MFLEVCVLPMLYDHRLCNSCCVFTCSSTGKSNIKEELFWKNYFFNCEKLRAQRVNTTTTTTTEIIETVANSTEMRKKLDRVINNYSIGDNNGDDDGESLIPADDYSVSAEVVGDDSSYVIASAPNSLNTITTTRSVEDDVVLISAPPHGGPLGKP